MEYRTKDARVTFAERACDSIAAIASVEREVNESAACKPDIKVTTPHFYGIATLETLNGSTGEGGVVAFPLLLSCPFTTKK